MSILAVELRRSAALGAALVIVTAGLVILYAAPGRWSAGWMALALTQREYTVLLWPLALAAGAWQGRREHRSKVADLFASTPRPRLRRMTPVLGAFAVVLGTGYLIITVGGLAGVFVTGGYQPLADFATVTAVGALSLIAAAWLGLGLGRLLPALATAPTLGAVSVLLLLFGTELIEPDWLAAVLSPIHGTSVYHPYQTMAGAVSAAHAVWLVALALTGVVLLAAGNRRTRMAALLPVVLGVALAVAVVPRDPDVVDTPVDPVARELVCTADAPKVCVSRLNAHLLPAFTPHARAGLALLAKLPDPPATVQENTTTYDPDELGRPGPAGTVVIPVRVGKRGGLGHPEAVIPEIVGSLGVRAASDCDVRAHPVERAAAYYLMGRPPVSEVGVIPGATFEDAELNVRALQLWQALRKLPEAEALARVTAVRQAIVDCTDSAGLLSRKAR